MIATSISSESVQRILRLDCKACVRFLFAIDSVIVRRYRDVKLRKHESGRMTLPWVTVNRSCFGKSFCN
jgi:hypothetical protein